MKASVAEIVTDRILKALDEGTVPWHKDWITDQGRQHNMVTGRNYRGINVILTGLANHREPGWATFNQIRNNGGMVKAGEKGTPIVFWNFIESRTERTRDGKPKQIPMLKYYTVFNIEQTTGMDRFHQEETGVSRINPITFAQNAFDDYVEREHIGVREGYAPSYSPLNDEIAMPPLEDFETSEGFYLAAFHECVHSSGPEKRLNRDTFRSIKNWGDDQYSREELVAEIGSCMLASEIGFQPDYKNSAAYIASWSRALRDDKMLIITASSRAEKACNYILGREAKDDESGESDRV